MGIRITVNRQTLDQGPTDRSPFVRRLGTALFMALLLGYLWFNFDFARYAVTGVFWKQTAGTVTSPGTTFEPTIRFEGIDGLSHFFSEDYILVCSRRVPCWPRGLHQGEVVPVVYDPARPQRAFVHDWALFANILVWLFVLGMTLLCALIVAMRESGKAMSLRIDLNQGDATNTRITRLRRLSINVPGLSTLGGDQSEVAEAKRVLPSLKEAIRLKLDPRDPQSVQKAIRQFDLDIDAKIAPYQHNKMVVEFARKVKIDYREVIEKLALSASKRK